MNENKKILILSMNVGTGHTRAAEAMKEAILQKDSNSKVKIIDTFYYANPWLGKMLISTYLEMIKVTPILYRFLYNKAEINNKFSFAGKREFVNVLNNFTETKITNLVEEFQPDQIICTHPFPLGIINTIKEKMKRDIPIMAVLTDFTVHPFWIFENVDTYVVAVTELKKELIKFGVDEGKVKVTGIPIDPRFSQGLDNELIKKAMGLNNTAPILMIMGGGLGLGPVKKIVKELNKLDIELQLLVVVGKNLSLQKKLTDMLPKLKFTTKIYGYINNVHELMEVSDLLITKPGGITSSEALAKGLPMVIVRPIPGQEERNCDFLIKCKVGHRVDSENNLPQVIKSIISDREKISTLKVSAKARGSSDSAMKVAELIFAETKSLIKGGVGID